MNHREGLSIFAAAAEAPCRIALITETNRFTYAELAALAAPRAATLVDFGAPLLLQPNGDLDSLLWLYAAFATGTPFVALDPRASAQELAVVQARTGARTAPPFEGGAPLVDALAVTPFIAPELDSQAPFSLLLTSGSTGTPKIVVSSRGAALASAAASAGNLGVEAGDRWLLCLALSHVAGLAIVVRMLVARRTIVLCAAAQARLSSRITDLGWRMQTQRVTLVSLVPTLLERLLRSGFTAPATLRAVLLGGAGCSPELAAAAQHAGIPLITSYGLTETGSQVVARRYAERYLPLAQHRGCVSSGHALANGEVNISEGRILIRTASLLSGYLGSLEPAVDARGWFVTNDRGEWGPQGELYVLGRTDLVIVTGGENVDPEEVEQALHRLPEVQDACVFGVPSQEFGQRLVAVVVPVVSDSRLDLEFLRFALRTELARCKLPRAMMIADALPRTPAGKLDRRGCIDRFAPSFRVDTDALREDEAR